MFTLNITITIVIIPKLLKIINNFNYIKKNRYL